MNKKVINSIIKIFLTTVLSLGTISTFQLETVPPTFASMGSTGGGHSHFSGGGTNTHYSPSHTYNSSTSSENDDETKLPVWLTVLELIVVTVVVLFIVIDIAGDFISSVFQFFIRLIHSLFIRIHLFYQYGVRNIPSFLFKPNIELGEFEETIRDNKIKLKKISQGNQYKNFSKVYIKAQFLYSQDLRERYVNKHYSL